MTLVSQASHQQHTEQRLLQLYRAGQEKTMEKISSFLLNWAGGQILLSFTSEAGVTDSNQPAAELSLVRILRILKTSELRKHFLMFFCNYCNTWLRQYFKITISTENHNRGGGRVVQWSYGNPQGVL